MKFGNVRRYTNKKPLTVKIGKDGVGEETHPHSDKFTNKPQRDLIEEKILSIVKGDCKEEKLLEKPGRLKLYLKTLLNIKLLSNRKKKFKNPQKKTIRSKIVNWWRKEKTQDAWDLVKFILIHGAIFIPTLLGILTITNLNIPLIQYIRGNIGLTMIIYTLGGGSFYYLFLDCLTGINDIFKKRGKR